LVVNLSVPPSEEILYIYDVVESGAAETEAELLNLWPLMQEEFAKNGKKFNSEYDGHWDAYGHGFVADQLLPLLDRNSTASLKSIGEPSDSAAGKH
jgi:hypothetical protein